MISCVINYYNPKAISRIDATTLLCLEALRAYSKTSPEIILSDGSGVESPLIKAHCERLGVLYSLSPTPQNFAAIYNHGFSLCQGDYIAILENDVFVSEAWDERMLSEMKRTGADVAVPFLTSCDNNIQQLGFLVQNITFEPSIISHNFILFTRKAAELAFPFNMSFKGSQNDSDVYIRLKRARMKFIVTKGAEMVHFRRGTAVYNPWRFDEDLLAFKELYPDFRYSSPIYAFSVCDPFFCRSRSFRMLLWLCERLPVRKLRNYWTKHIFRLESLFHRI
jgi:glycosyltransferase involved in cell wall biosynthesis